MTWVPDYPAELRKQLGFIERSCRDYDEGHAEEAIRIGTSLRVLLHDTAKSTSLLTHMKAKDSVTLLTTCRNLLRGGPNEPPGMTPQFAFGLGILRFGQEGTIHLPLLDEHRYRAMVSVHDWWSQVVWMLDPNTLITRRDIVLEAANRDGGAHVAGKLKPPYERLLKGPFDSFVRVSGEGTQPDNTHLVSLRQLGYEIMGSPDLYALAR